MFFAIFYCFYDINKKNTENGLAVDFEDANFDVENIGSKVALRYPNWVGPREGFVKKSKFEF